CEEYASALSNQDLTTGASEKSEIHIFIERSITRLKGEDKQLPQVLRMRDLLYRGIGVHHSGLLPILKEIVEILFTRGLIKVLFTTETFAMGVNAPARCVVFSATRKHDGQDFRDLLPGEYTQMSGRAGRRGLDATGMVLIMCKDYEVPDPMRLRAMITGVPTKLQSRFRLTYNMILNLLRVEALKVEEMIKRSFGENSGQKAVPEQQKRLEESNKNLKNIPKLACTICSADIYAYYDACFRILQIGYEVGEKLMTHPVGMKALSVGRIVIVNNTFYRNAPAVFLRMGSIADHSDKKSAVLLVLSEKIDATTNNELGSLPVTKVAVPARDRISHKVASVRTSDMAVITRTIIKVNQPLEFK
ncbi:hypothetical protein HK096_009385, partial [Nowakowskiella sp. JEL0078]